jgi:hypothetical protein
MQPEPLPQPDASGQIHWQPAIDRRNFRLGELEYASAFLDRVWSLELPDIGAQDPSLKPLLLSVSPSPTDLRVDVAGKDDGPDPVALALARDVMSRLSYYLYRCNDLMKFESKHGCWHLDSVAVPYQVEGTEIWYVECISDYGSDFTFCWQRTVQNGEAVCGFAGAGQPEGPLSWVPYTVRWIVDELKVLNLSSPTFASVLRTIRDTKTMGCELIVPLMNVIEESRGTVPAWQLDHWMTHLSNIRQHARPG